MEGKTKEHCSNSAQINDIITHDNFSKQFIVEGGGVCNIPVSVMGTYEKRMMLLNKENEVMEEWVKESQGGKNEKIN